MGFIQLFPTAILRPRTASACSISSFRFMVYGDELHGAERSSLPEGVLLLLESENPTSPFGKRGRIRYARPTHRLEDTMPRIPESNWRRAPPALIPGSVDEGRFREDTVCLPSMPADQYILTCGKRLGGTAHTSTASTEAYGILLHEQHHIPRPLVNNLDFQQFRFFIKAFSLTALLNGPLRTLRTTTPRTLYFPEIRRS